MKIAVDMDGTIADFTTTSFQKVEELWGIKMTREDAYKPKTSQLVWERMTDKQKSKYGDHRELYAEICAKGFFLDLEPLPGAIDVVKRLAKKHDIFFLTKPLNWDRSAPEKAVWLDKYFHDIDYTIIMVDSVKAKHIIDVDIVIDDDSRVHEGLKAPAIMIAQPWNKTVRENNPGQISVAENMEEAEKFVDMWEEEIVKWKERWSLEGDE